MESLDAMLRRRTREGTLWEPVTGGRVRCHACAHQCVIADGAAGVCGVRVNREGRLWVPWGYVAGLQCDPIEKKPFFHAWPGSLACSFGMLGCDLRCPYCQNWISSQALRDPLAGTSPIDVEPGSIVTEATRRRARVVVSTYNEPLITAEWAVAVFQAARAAGLATGLVSNGFGSPEVVAYLAPWVDLVKIDLKSFDERTYHRLGGRLEPVLETIRAFHGVGAWVEVVTLLVPGLNDAPDELRRLSAFLASVSLDLPWHVTAYHRGYRLQSGRDTEARDLLRAAAIGREVGLRYVYAGNLPDAVGDLEQTRCAGCGAVVVERCGYRIGGCHLTDDGHCRSCGAAVPGRWNAAGLPRSGHVPAAVA